MVTTRTELKRFYISQLKNVTKMEFKNEPGNTTDLLTRHSKLGLITLHSNMF